MANICTNTLEITGSKEDIALFTKKITEQDKELLELFCWLEKTNSDYGMWEDSLNTEPDEIYLSFGSKWGFPDKEFNSLVAEYSRLNFKASWKEPGMEEFGKVSGSRGATSYTNLTPLDYYTEFNTDFFEEHQQIENLPYDKFLEYVAKFTTDYDDYSYSYLEPLIIKRIKPKDLPLFIDKEWQHCEEEFIKKLKGE